MSCFVIFVCDCERDGERLPRSHEARKHTSSQVFKRKAAYEVSLETSLGNGSRYPVLQAKDPHAAAQHSDANVGKHGYMT